MVIDGQVVKVETYSAHDNGFDDALSANNENDASIELLSGNDDGVMMLSDMNGLSFFSR